MVYVAGSISTNTGVAPGVHNRRGRRHEGERHGNHFIARPDAGGQQRQMQRARPRIYADGLGRAAVGRELALERGDFLPENELRAVQHPQDGGVDFRLDRSVLTAEICVRNHPGGHSLYIHGPAVVLHRRRGRFEQPHHPKACFAVALSACAPRVTQSTKWAASTASASVTLSFGAHMSPVR